MKNRSILTAVFASLLITGSSFFPLTGQEAPSPDRSSKEASKEKFVPLPSPILIKAEKTEKAEIRTKKATGKPAPKKPAVNERPDGIMFVVEWIEVDHRQFSDWVFDNELSTDATELRKEIQEWVNEDDARIVETVVINARSGQRAQSESIEEVIYPTEFDPPETPNQPTLRDKTEIPVIPASGSAFETRNTGVTTEIDPVLSEDGKWIDLNLAPELVYYIDDIEHVTESNGEEQVVRQPLFAAAKITTQITIRNGGYTLVGTARLPQEDDDEDRVVLLFVRADAG